MTQFKSLILFETKRLQCRQLSLADADDLYAVYSDAEAMRWVDDGQPITRETCTQWINVTLKNYVSRGYGMSALVSKETGTIIDFCGLVHPNDQPEAEIKYALRREYWGIGLATEAARAMLEYGRRVFQLHEVISTTAPENAASHRVLLKVGMTEITSRHDFEGSSIKVFKWQSNER